MFVPYKLAVLCSKEPEQGPDKTAKMKWMASHVSEADEESDEVVNENVLSNRRERFTCDRERPTDSHGKRLAWFEESPFLSRNKSLLDIPLGKRKTGKVDWQICEPNCNFKAWSEHSDSSQGYEEWGAGNQGPAQAQESYDLEETRDNQELGVNQIYGDNKFKGSHDLSMEHMRRPVAHPELPSFP